LVTVRTLPLPYAWLARFGLTTDGSADFADSDGDGLNNWQEWRVGTDPVNESSALRVVSVSAANPGMTVRWQSVSGRLYFLERSTNLALHPPFASLASNIVAEADMSIYTDTNAIGKGPFFYRVGTSD